MISPSHVEHTWANTDAKPLTLVVPLHHEPQRLQQHAGELVGVVGVVQPRRLVLPHHLLLLVLFVLANDATITHKRSILQGGTFTVC